MSADCKASEKQVIQEMPVSSSTTNGLPNGRSIPLSIKQIPPPNTYELRHGSMSQFVTKECVCKQDDGEAEIDPNYLRTNKKTGHFIGFVDICRQYGAYDIRVERRMNAMVASYFNQTVQYKYCHPNPVDGSANNGITYE